MGALDRPVTFGVIVGSRAFFNPKLASEGRTALLARLETLGYGYIIPEERATPNGAIETLADARKIAGLFQANRAKIDGIVVTLPNFGDEQGVVQAIELAKLGVPVLLHAFDDDPQKVDLAHRRDAFCGKLSVANNFYQYGIPWTDTAEHTCPVDGEELEGDLDFFARVCRVVRGLKGARIGAIGTRPAAFQTVRYSEKLLQASGITVIPVDLSEIIAAAEKIRENTKEVHEKLSTIRGYGSIASDVPDSLVTKQAKLGVAIDRWIAENECSASAVQCWTSIQKNYGCAACLSMSLMTESGKPSACEVDVTGAVSMLALRLASGNPPGFVDWNNNYGTDREKCITFHCSNHAKSFIGGPIEIADQEILGASLGKEYCFGAIKGKAKAGPMTYFRMHTDDQLGICVAYTGEGEFTDDPCAMNGGIAVCKIPNLRKVMSYAAFNGFEHHVSMVRGRWARVLHEAASKYMDWEVQWFADGGG